MSGPIRNGRPERKQKMKITRTEFWAIVAGALAVLIAAAWFTCGRAAEKPVITCWIVCQPGDHVNVRETPSKKGRQTGFLECGDAVQTDAESRNGFIRVYGVGEGAEGWVYSGYVSTAEPVEVFENYVCVAKKRAACRRWLDGPQIEGRTGWIYNGSTVSVFYIAGDWAVTSRGYIKSEWLEVNPE